MVRLSSSRIKTLKSCSYLYYSKYHLNLPSRGNTGSKLGSITHLILECLSNKKRRPVVDKCIETERPIDIESINRLALKHLKKQNIFSEENVEKINGFLVCALENDFYGEGCLDVKIEYEFDLATDSYRCYGFIDVIKIFPDKVVIVDYKTSKEKFQKSSEDYKFNLQGAIYSLVASKMFPNKPIEVQFLFLKFRKNPKFIVNFSQKQLEGLEHYLAHINEYVSDFGVEKAFSDFAIKSPDRRWLCGFSNDPFALKADGSPQWSCESKFPLIFFEASKPGEKSVTAFTRKELDKYVDLGYEISQKRYGGCPAHT